MNDKELYLYIEEDSFKSKVNTTKNIKEITKQKLFELYGKDIATDIKKRYEYELNAIIKNHFEEIYMLLYIIAHKAKEDKETFIPKGISGSSFIMYLLGISFVNPIEYNIPFEICAGILGNKMPYLYFDFSHKYIDTIYEFTKNYLRKNNISFSTEDYDDSKKTDYKFLTISFQVNKDLGILKKLESVTNITHYTININDKKLFQEDILFNHIFGFKDDYSKKHNKKNKTQKHH